MEATIKHKSSTLTERRPLKLEDEEVQELKKLKSVNKNGEVIERIQQNIHVNQEPGASVHKTQVMTEMEVPSKGLNNGFEEDSLRKFEKNPLHNLLANNLLQAIKSKNIVRFQPEEMAEYIYETGDENTVTTTIENYLQLGILSHEEALWYLKRIKSMLNLLEEQEIREKRQDQRHFYDTLYDNPKNSKMDVAQALSDLRNIQQLIQDKYMKQFPDDRISERSNSRYDRNAEDAESDDVEAFESEVGYRNIAEKLEDFENIFSKTSMESVIYQLVKILFYQSFSMNDFEAQESIKQFTSFLEGQVEEGRLSRNVERKVFDILLAALVDTLNEHPELMERRTKQSRHQNVNSNQKNNRDAIKFNVIEKKNDKTKTKHMKAGEKSLDLKSSGIQDDAKRLESKN